MPHQTGSGLSLLNLDDPVDRQIAKFEFTQAQLLGQGLANIVNPPLDQLRQAGAEGIDVLGSTALELFAGIVLPDFTTPFEVTVEPDPVGPVGAGAAAVAARQTFTTLFTESNLVLQEGTGREDLVFEG